MAKKTIRERTFEEFMKRFDRDEDLDNPFVVGMKMMVSSLISPNGFSTALDTLSVCFLSNNIVVYSQDFKPIDYVKRPTIGLTNIVKAHVSKHGKRDFYEEFEDVISKKVRKVTMYSIHTDRHYYYIVVLDLDLINETHKKDAIDASKIAFYTIFEHYEMVKALKINAQVDALTGIKNRFMYQKVIKNLPKLGPELTFVVCDLFSLKHINDEYGHPVGDTYLKRAAQSMENQFPKCVYKVGGDEFIIIAPGNSDVDIKMKLANEELTRAMKRVIKKPGEIYHINYGYHHGSTAEVTASAFYRTADKNLSKDKGDFYSNNHVERRRRESDSKSTDSTNS